MSIFGASTTPGAGLFGNAGAQQSNTGTNMFGTTNPQAQPAGAAIQFGSTPQNQPGQQQQQQQQPQQPSIFGATRTNAQGAAGGTGAGMFGSFGQTGAGAGGNTGAGTGAGTFGNLGGATNPQQGTTPAGTTPGAGFFPSLNTGQTQPGAASGTTGAGAGLFGNQQAGAASGAGAGLFGNPAGGSGGFGAAGSTNTSQQPAAPGAGLFGGGGTSNLFGASTTTNPAGSTGQTPAQPQQQGMFGSLNAGAGAAGTAGSGTAAPIFGAGLFGASTLNPAGAGTAGAGAAPGAGMFGSMSTAGAAKPAGSNIFGLSTNTAPGAGTGFGSMFPMAGAAAAPQSQLQKSTLFGSASGASALGGSSLLPSAAQTRSLQNQTDAHLQFVKLVQQIQLVKESWEPTSPLCRFRHVFYNLVDPSQVSRYERPGNVAPELWEKGVKENPDPTCLVPVVANGFDDLRERVKGQTDSAAKQEAVFKELKTRLDTLQEKHSTNNLSRLQRAQYQQTRITQRMLAFIQHLHLLIPAVRSSAMRPEEEVLRSRLEDIEEEMRRGRIKEKLNELWALTGALYAHRRSLPDNTNNEWTVVDDDGMAQLVAILSEQQAGLAHLTKVLQKALKDLAIIMGAKEPVPETMDESAMDEDLWSSTTSLRVSALR